MQRQVTGALAVAVVAFLAAGCGARGTSGVSGRGQSPQVTAPGCPADAPPPVPPGGPAGHGGLVRTGPAAVAVCQYRSGGRARHPTSRRIVLRARAAAGLAAVVNSGGPVTAGTRRCDRTGRLLPYPQIFIFVYPGGPPERVAVAQLSCDRAVLTARGRSAVLGFQVAADLFALSTLGAHPHGPRTPRLVGLSAAEAVASARRQHVSISFDGAVVDPAERFGTVVFQSLPAGLRDGGPGREVDVLTAVGRSPRCAAGQLVLSYLGGQPGAGNDFGNLVIGDRSPRACTLAGPLDVTGLNRAGHEVTNTVRFPLAGVTVLSPGAGAITSAGQGGSVGGVAPGDLTGMIVLRAEYRDGPSNVDRGLCTPLWVVPATWRVALPDSGSLTVANADRHRPGLVPSGGFVTCRGHLGGVSPATVGSLGAAGG